MLRAPKRPACVLYSGEVGYSAACSLECTEDGDRILSEIFWDATMGLDAVQLANLMEKLLMVHNANTQNRESMSVGTLGHLEHRALQGMMLGVIDDVIAYVDELSMKHGRVHLNVLDVLGCYLICAKFLSSRPVHVSGLVRAIVRAGCEAHVQALLKKELVLLNIVEWNLFPYYNQAKAKLPRLEQGQQQGVSAREASTEGSLQDGGVVGVKRAFRWV